MERKMNITKQITIMAVFLLALTTVFAIPTTIPPTTMPTTTVPPPIPPTTMPPPVPPTTATPPVDEIAEIEIASQFVENVKRSQPQKYDDDELLDDKRELAYMTFKIPITVVGDATFTDIVVDTGFTFAQFTDEVATEVGLSLNRDFPFTISDKTENIELTLLVPSNLDAIDSSFDSKKHEISVTFVTEKQSIDSTHTLTVENGLELDSVEVEAGSLDFECDVEDDTELDCDNEAEELPLETDFDVVLVVENNLDQDLEDIEFDIDNDNNDIEPDDKSFNEDIDEDDEIEVKITFEVDNDVEDRDDDEIEFSVLAFDENGAMHGFRYTMEIEFDEETKRGSSNTNDRNSNTNNNYQSTQPTNNNGVTQTPTRAAPATPSVVDPVIVVRTASSPTIGTQQSNSKSDADSDLIYPITLAAIAFVLLLFIMIFAVMLLRK